MHTKNTFSQTRAVILGLTSLVDLVIAILFLVVVVSDWVAFDTLQKTITLALFFINVFSALILAFMCILRSRLRPMGDLARGIILLVFQIVVLFFLFLFPILRLSKGQFVLPQPAEKPLSSPMSDTASALTYYSWDRNPEKGLKHATMESYYSQGSYAASYKFSLYEEKGRGGQVSKFYTDPTPSLHSTTARTSSNSWTHTPSFRVFRRLPRHVVRCFLARGTAEGRCFLTQTFAQVRKVTCPGKSGLFSAKTKGTGYSERHRTYEECEDAGNPPASYDPPKAQATHALNRLGAKYGQRYV
ncbi:hypothetical protein EST38_g6983 [Candolleomyces aberdarensis]|uniref:Uncharacterized protein n=1 Tax=Candolleomyces aberdarensis TaxID=2316362 RepID=A0A4Q2DGC1_9AGAR|nr:hypothetical protein EST38_g6983 [Candolleomyces aberdarensis]